MMTLIHRCRPHVHYLLQPRKVPAGPSPLLPPQLTPTPSLTFLQVSTTHFLQRISQDLRQLGISLGTGALVNTE